MHEFSEKYICLNGLVKLTPNEQRYAASRFDLYNFVCEQNAHKWHKCFCL
jgi:hypothetical protein